MKKVRFSVLALFLFFAFSLCSFAKTDSSEQKERDQIEVPPEFQEFYSFVELMQSSLYVEKTVTIETPDYYTCGHSRVLFKTLFEWGALIESSKEMGAGFEDNPNAV